MLVYMQIGKFVAEIDGNVAAMRATCKHWKAGVASVATALTPLVSSFLKVVPPKNIVNIF
jgi:hypothetical protein